MKELGHLKLVHFFVSATFGAIIPYLPVLFICNGVGFLRSGILLSLPPLIGLFSRPLLLSLIERFSYFKPSLVIGIALNVFVLLLLQTIHLDLGQCFDFNHGTWLSPEATHVSLTDSYCHWEYFQEGLSLSCNYKIPSLTLPDQRPVNWRKWKPSLNCCFDSKYWTQTSVNDELIIGKCFTMNGLTNKVSETEIVRPVIKSCKHCDDVFANLTYETVVNRSCDKLLNRNPPPGTDNTNPFTKYGVVMTAYSTFSCVILPVLDTLSMQYCRNLPDSDFNMLKLWATAGFGNAALLSSVLLSFSEYFKTVSLFHGFLPFIPFTIFSVIGLILTSYFKFPVPAPSAQQHFSISSLIQTSESLVFILVMTALGCFSGIHSIFFVLFILYLNDAYYIFIGIAYSMYTFLDLFMYFTRRKILITLGARAIIYFALTTYFLRFYIYSWASNALFILPVEILHVVCFSSMWYASVNLAAQLAPMGFSAAFQTLVSNVYWHVGVGLGALIGGLLYEEFGNVFLWRSSAFAALSTGILYVIFTHMLHPFLSRRGCIPTAVAADTQDFFEDDIDDLLDDNLVGSFGGQQNFTSDEEYLILDAPGDYSIVNSKGEQFVTPERDSTGESISAANRGQFQVLGSSGNAGGATGMSYNSNKSTSRQAPCKVLNKDVKFTIEDINV